MPQMTENMAREILDVAIKTGAWGEAGETATSVSSEVAFAEAQELVNLARQAYEKKTEAGDPIPEAVCEILFAAQVEPVDGKFDDIYKSKGAEPPASSNGTAAAAPAETESDGLPEGFDINSVYEGYDDQKPTAIKETILQAAASGDLTEDEFKLIIAYEQASEDRQRASILKLKPEFKQPEPEPQGMASSDTGGFTPQAEPSDYSSSSHFEQAYERGTLGTDRARQEGLPTPPPFEGDEPVLPVDITAISHQDLSRLSMRFHSLEARTLWLLSQEEGRQEACVSLRHDAHRSAFVRERSKLEAAIEKKTEAALDRARSDASRAADDDSSVVKWRNRERHHAAEARDLKARLEGYQRATARLSREQARRENLAATPAK